jgi:hypothetical protein
MPYVAMRVGLSVHMIVQSIVPLRQKGAPQLLGDDYVMEVWHAGEIVPPGVYMRIDNGSRRVVVLKEEGPLPPGFDGHVAIYCRAATRRDTPVLAKEKLPAPSSVQIRH